MSINSLIIRPMIRKLLGVHACMSEDSVVLIVSVRTCVLEDIPAA
jgi:hypothetical protein